MATVNLCGIIVLWQDYSLFPKNSEKKSNILYPESNSRNGRQKRQIANSVEWIRLNAKNKPLVFTLTVPVISDYTTQNTNVSKYFENFTKNYHCNNYVWVREYQPSGRPHYHVVADVPFFNIYKVNSYWSNLWDSTAPNSVRLNRRHNRFVERDSKRLCWYLCKYLGKSLADHEKGLRIRKFAVSKEANQNSQPYTVFANDISDTLANYDIRNVGQGISFAVPKEWKSK